MQVRSVAPVFLGVSIAFACSAVSGGSSQLDRGSAGAGNGISSGGSAGSGPGNGSAGTETVLMLGSAGSGAASASGGAGSLDSDAACATTSADGQPVPVDLFFMVDITGSMNCKVPLDDTPCIDDPGFNHYPSNRWSAVSTALKAFIADPSNSGLGVGIQFFPSRQQSCAAATYTTPAVEIGTLPATSMMLTDAIDAQRPSGSTPTVPSLDGALQHANAWATAHPTHRVAVVYATDGDPKECGANNTIANAAILAGAALAATPSIPTYVLGVGPSLTNLNQIATAGSKQMTPAFLVDATANAAADLAKALAAIRTSAALGCTYSVPPAPAGETFQPGLVRVEYTDSKGNVKTVLQDPPQTDCAQGQGWQYSADKTQINLCGPQCEAVKADPGGKLQVLFGCATLVAEPR